MKIIKNLKYFLILGCLSFATFTFAETTTNQNADKQAVQKQLSKKLNDLSIHIETLENMLKTINTNDNIIDKIIIDKINNIDKSIEKIKTLEEELDELESSLSKSLQSNINNIQKQIDTIADQVNKIENKPTAGTIHWDNVVGKPIALRYTNDEYGGHIVKGDGRFLPNVMLPITASVLTNNIEIVTNKTTQATRILDQQYLRVLYSNFHKTSLLIPFTSGGKKYDSMLDHSHLSGKLKLQNIDVSTNDFFNAEAIKVAQNIVNTHLLNSRLSGAAEYHRLWVNRETGNDTNALYYAMVSPYISLGSREKNPFKTLDVALRVAYAQGNHAVIYITGKGRGMHHVRKSTLHALSGAGLHIVSQSPSTQFILIDFDKKPSKGGCALHKAKYSKEYNANIVEKENKNYFYYWGQYGSYLHLEGSESAKVILGMAGTEGIAETNRLNTIPTRFYDYIHPKLSTHLSITYHGIGVYTKNAEIWARVGLGYNATHNSGGNDLIWMTDSTLNSEDNIGNDGKFKYYMDAYSYKKDTDTATVEYLTWEPSSLFPTYHELPGVKIGNKYSIPQEP